MRLRAPASSQEADDGNLILAAIAECRGPIVALVLFSGIINILMLTGSFYMLQVYDRVLLSYSIPTLVMLSIIALFAYAFMGFLDVVRTRIFGRIADKVDAKVGPELYRRVVRHHASRPGSVGEQMQPFRDLDAIRNFLSGTGPVAVFDMPWLPIYLIICFFLHPLVGVFATLSAVLLVIVTIAGELMTRKPLKQSFEMSSQRNMLGAGSIGGSEALVSMGMLGAMQERWRGFNARNSDLALHANDVTSSVASISRTLRMVIQSAVLGLGAYLAVKGEMTAGTIIAASIISARAIAPIDLAVASYKSYQQAGDGYRRLVALLRASSDQTERLRLPAPRRLLQVDNIVVAAPSTGAVILKGISFNLLSGEALGIIGQSASGKSTLGRALVGLWTPMRGMVALDGAPLTHWDQEWLGRHVGYLPHDIQLFDGTVAQNISRFEPDPPAEKIFAAVNAAGCLELIQQLPDGFSTRIGTGGTHLSAGQRQRLGLARALYGDPFLIVLDEPNANLDAQGEAAVTSAIAGARSRGAITVVIAHRPSAVQSVDKLMVLRDGFMTAFGEKNEVLKQVVSNAATIGAALTSGQKADRGDRDAADKPRVTRVAEAGREVPNDADA